MIRSEYLELDYMRKFYDYMKYHTNLADSSMETYFKIIRIFILTYGDKFTIKDVNEFIADKNTKEKRAEYYPYAFKHFLTSVGKKVLCDQIHTPKQRPRIKEFSYIPKPTMELIINDLPLPYKHFALIQLKSGLRYTELFHLRCEVFDFFRHPSLIIMRISAFAKGEKERFVPIHKKYEMIIKKYMNGRTYGFLWWPRVTKFYPEVKFNRLFTNTQHAYNRHLTDIGEKYYVKGLTSHYLRHCFSDYFLESGGSESTLTKILGHARIDTTMRYISITDHQINKVMENME